MIRYRLQLDRMVEGALHEDPMAAEVVFEHRTPIEFIEAELSHRLRTMVRDRDLVRRYAAPPTLQPFQRAALDQMTRTTLTREGAQALFNATLERTRIEGVQFWNNAWLDEPKAKSKTHTGW